MKHYLLVQSPIWGNRYKIVNIDENRTIKQLSTIFTNIKNLDELFTNLEKYQEDSIHWSYQFDGPHPEDVIAVADTIQELKQKVPYLFL